MTATSTRYWVNGLRFDTLKEALKEGKESHMPVYEVICTCGVNKEGK